MPLIDVHAHWLPPLYLDAMHAAGIHDVEGWPLPRWDRSEHLERMARQDIASSILSVSAPGINFMNGPAARDLARRMNEAAADARETSQGRFGAFAVLTLPDVDGALREMEYALDTLKLDGIGLLTNIRGVHLGDPAFDAVLAEADRRGAVIYTHPVAPEGYEKLVMGFSASALEYPFDTTRMILNLIATGTLRRYRSFKLIASHGGGATPFLGWRMANIAAIMNRLTPPMTPEEAEAQMHTIYFDSTAISNAVSLASYKAFVPADRRLFGSDTPFMTEATTPPAVAAVRGIGGLDGTQADALEHGNAAAIFPRVANLLRRAA